MSTGRGPSAGRTDSKTVITMREAVKTKRSQAVSELAIFGTLIIVAFAAVLSYLQMTNTQQALQMRAFRMAIQLSRHFNQEITYTIVRDSPIFDITDPFGRPDTSRQIVSSTVAAVTEDPLFFHADDIDERASREFYNVNGREFEVAPIRASIQYSKKTFDAWMAAPIVDVEYQIQKERTGGLIKGEDEARISTRRFGRVTTRGNVNLILEDKATFEQNYLDEISDEVEEEPWERRFKIESEQDQLESQLVWLTGIITQLFQGKPCVSMTKGQIVKIAISLAAQYVIEYVFGRLLEGYTDMGIPQRVDAQNYVTDVLNAPSDFSVPERIFDVNK